MSSLASKHRDSAHNVSVPTSHTPIVFIDPFKMIFSRFEICISERFNFVDVEFSFEIEREKM